MLGLIFTEFIEMVEDRFSAETADTMLSSVPTSQGGAYTAVGYYPHEDLVAMVVKLSELTGIAIPELVRTFGRHLMKSFVHNYAAVFERHQTFFDCLAAVDGEIHVEVHKLYEHAVLPRFDVMERSDTRMKILYRSARHLEPLAVGLIEGLAAHYGQACRIDQQPWSDGTSEGTTFDLTLQAA